MNLVESDGEEQVVDVVSAEVRVAVGGLHFEDAVNVTLGLPIVRTAPDHGTAFDIAGQDRADPRPMAAAIRMAADSANLRAESA